jgi:transposase
LFEFVFFLFVINLFICKNQLIVGDLAPTDIARAVAMLENGRTYSDIAQMFGQSKSTIHRSVSRWRQTGKYVRRRGQGRKRSTTAVDDRFLALQTLRNRRQTAVQTRNALQDVRGTNITERRVRRRLKGVGLKSYVPIKATRLQRRHRVARATRIWPRTSKLG